MSKLRVSMKDPDVLYDAVNDLVDEELIGLGLDDDEMEGIREARREKYRKIASKWFQYGEYLTVVIDLEAKTIEVEDAKS